MGPGYAVFANLIVWMVLNHVIQGQVDLRDLDLVQPNPVILLLYVTGCHRFPLSLHLIEEPGSRQG